MTSVFEQQNLVAAGVIIEAYSVEDKGEGICFNVFVFNVQPGIEIDYSDGSSWGRSRLKLYSLCIFSDFLHMILLESSIDFSTCTC